MVFYHFTTYKGLGLARNLHHKNENYCEGGLVREVTGVILYLIPNFDLYKQ